MLDVQRRSPDLALVRLDHGAVNALDRELLEALTAAMVSLTADADVRAIVVTGNERAFSAGVDLKRLLEEGVRYTETFLDALSEALLAPVRSSKPVVAAVGGHAIAGGAVLAAACDRVMGVDDDRVLIGLPELAVGVPLPAAAVEIMRRRLGPKLSETVLTANTYAMQQAREIGFVDAVAPRQKLVDHACQAAAALGRVPSTTMALAKEQLRGPIEAALAAHGAEHNARVQEAWCSEEGRTAIRDFVANTLGGRRDARK